MTRITWDQTGERRYETGVDHGVLYPQANDGSYPLGVAWNGLTTVTESPSGADATAQYADNIKYLNLIAAEEFGGTIEAFTYPIEFEKCDGTASPQAGVSVGQQRRQPFGFAYRTLVGNDIEGTDFGYKLHLVYGALAAPSEKARATVNDSPEALGFSWEFSTTAVEIPGTNPDTGKPFKPSATITVDSTEVDATALAALETILYGSAGVDPRLPSPAEVFALFANTVTAVTPAAPTYNGTTHVITVPNTTGVVYRRGDNNAVVTNTTITLTTGQSLVIRAVPAQGYVFANNSDDDWSYSYS